MLLGKHITLQIVLFEKSGDTFFFLVKTFDLESNLESSYSLESNCTDILPRVSYFNFWWFVESHFGGCFCLFAPKFWGGSGHL